MYVGTGYLPRYKFYKKNNAFITNLAQLIQLAQFFDNIRYLRINN